MFNSIRTKLFLSLIAIGVGPLILLTMFIFSSVNNYEKTDMRTELLRIANTISTNLSVQEYFNNTEDSRYLENVQVLLEERFIIINKEGQVTYDSNHFDDGKLITSFSALRILQGDKNHLIEEDNNSATIYTPIFNRSYTEVEGVMILIGDFSEINDSFSRMRSIALLIIIGITMIIFILTFYFSGLLTKPFSQLLKHLNRVSEGYIDEKLEIKGNYEIEEIVDAFNNMLTKINEIDNSRQQFVANVSHELKTPLSSMKVLAESLLSMDNAPIEYYIEFMEDINSEIDREAQIIDDLLTLVTLDKKENQLNISQVNINTLIEQVMRMLKPVAEKKNIILEIKSYRHVNAMIDETKMYLVFMNLIENGIKYNVEGGKVTVSINCDHRMLTAKIIDTGIGIPESQVGKVFERFYRVDKMRSRDTGGTGLGLNIVYKTVLMHGGSIKCESKENEGSTFILKIPLTQQLTDY